MPGILLGRESAPSSPFGFDNQQPASGKSIRYSGEAPLTIIAPVVFPLAMLHGVLRERQLQC